MTPLSVTCEIELTPSVRVAVTGTLLLMCTPGISVSESVLRSGFDRSLDTISVRSAMQLEMNWLDRVLMEDSRKFHRAGLIVNIEQPSNPSSTSTPLLELSDLHRISSYMSRSPTRLSVVKPLDMLLLQFGILSHSTSDIHLLLVPLNLI